MEKIPGYKILKQMDESLHRICFRALREYDGRTVVMHIFKNQFPSPVKLAHFKQEFEQAKQNSDAGFVSLFEMITHNNRIILVCEDIKGVSLKETSIDFINDLPAFLTFGIQIAEALGDWHAHHLIHKDIRPHNIWIQTESKKIKIGGFGFLSEFTQEKENIYDPGVIDNFLVYLSPEQTGRMNRAVDYRTDLYSLGITFYEMLTGHVPFTSAEPLEIIHAHIAKSPISPDQINPVIPQMLSKIILKLLSKTAEQRYQNSYGLAADLKKCLEQIELTGTVDPFPIARNDISISFNIPQLLIGRETQIDVLMSTFDEVITGKKEIMLVTGAPGIGKSALIHEIHKPIVAQKGFFLTGKYDQFKKDVPYSAIIQAFSFLVKQILTESSARIKIWQETVQNALGTDGKVITDIIPEVELIIGPQLELASIAPEEMQNRFNHVFKNFIRVFASATHPVALFLDDLQWADAASYKFILNILSDPDITHMLFIGSYRDNEIDDTHPLNSLLQGLYDRNIVIKTIHLEALTENHVNRMVANFLRLELEISEPFARIVHLKTGGNPFFINQFLKTLYEDKILALDPKAGWVWDQDQIEQMQVTENVVELMARKITKLPQETQTLLKTCACVGNWFDLETLAIVLDISLEEVLQGLFNAISEGLIHQSREVYRFHHDRIQEAAYSLLDEESRIKMHHRIGQFLFKNTPKDALDDKILYIVNHINTAAQLLKTRKKRHEAAQLNLLAVKKANKSNAVESALTYARAGVQFLDGDSWEDHYQLCFGLHIHLAECEYLNKNFGNAGRMFTDILKRAKTRIEKAKIYDKQATLLINIWKIDESIDALIKGLKILKIDLPKNPGQSRIMWEAFKEKIARRNTPITELIHLPEMTDPEKIVAMELLMNLCNPAFYKNQKLLALVALKMIDFSIRYGITEVSAYACSAYAAVLLGLNFVQSKTGHQYGKLAIALAEKYNHQGISTKVLAVNGGFVHHWHAPATESIERLNTAYQYAIETTDMNYLGLSTAYILFHMMFIGAPLDQVLAKCHEFIKALKKSRNAIEVIEFATIAAIENFKGKSIKPLSLDSAYYTEAQFELIRNKAVLYWYYLQKTQVAYIFQAMDQAKANIEMTRKNRPGSFGLISSVEYFFYDALIIVHDYAHLSQRDQVRADKRLSRHLKKLQLFSQSSPANFTSRYEMLQAEMARIANDYKTAVDHYDRAIKNAGQNKHLMIEALAYELAAKFYLTQEKTEIADIYLKNAHQSYTKWGATAKATLLEKTFSQFFSAPPPDATRNRPSDDDQDTDEAKGRIFNRHIVDFATIVKASQAISKEFQLNRLLETIIGLAIENAGAQKGYLIMQHEEDNRLYIEATGQISGQPDKDLKGVWVEQCHELPATIVNYVFKTNENVVLQKALDDPRFSKDPYIQTNKIKSILCAPIRHKGKMSGIIYLENNLADYAFPDERLEILKIMSSQSAISIENARLYEQLEARNKALFTINEQVNHLLEATKEMSRARDKVHACITALEHLAALEKSIQIKQADIFLPQKSDQTFSRYRVWENNIKETHPKPQAIQADQGQALKQIVNFQESQNIIRIPIRSKKQPLAIIEIVKDSAQSLIDKANEQFINGIIQSLSLTLENIESEETQRLAGIGTVAASILHDLKNPIGIIMGYANMAGDPALSAEQRLEYLNIISKEADRMSNMAHEVLAFSRGQVNLTMQEIGSTVFRRLITEMLEPIFIDSPVVFECMETFNGMLNMDMEKICRVIGNLATNARDAMTGAGIIMPRFELSINRAANGVRIVAKDNGPGIPEEIQANLFEPFVTHGKSHGTGLGMAIVKKIVDAHNGTIHFISKPGKGTEFIIFLPVSREISSKPSKEEPISEMIIDQVKNAPSLARNISILLAEDNPLNQKLILHILNKYGYTVDVVSDGSQAVKALESKTYDVVLMDVQMPIMDGIEATRTIRDPKSNVADHLTPIIALTAHSMDEELKRCIDAGMQECVLKPIKIEELENAIEKNTKTKSL